MKNTKQLRVLSSFLLIFFLFTALVLRSFSALSPSQETSNTAITKKADTSSASTQLIYDVKEGEERSENGCGNEDTRDFQDHFFLIGMVSTPLLFILPESQRYTLYSTSHSFGNSAGVPLYITQRSFLI